MARFKPIYKGLKLLPVDIERQVIPGSFEYAFCHLVDHELDLSAFHVRYNNDVDGASAFDPAVLIKIILLAYSRGSSRKQDRSSMPRECAVYRMHMPVRLAKSAMRMFEKKQGARNEDIGLV